MEIPAYLYKEVVKSDAYVDPAALPAIKDPNHLVLIEGSLESSPFTRSSTRHGRTMEDPEGFIFNNEPVTDEFGDVYTTFSIKGADCSLPAIRYNPIEHSYVRVRGMLDAATFPRCQAVSRHLRENGVLTEWPMLHARPKLFPDGERDLPLQAFRAQLYNNYLLELEAQKKTDQKYIERDSIGVTGLIGQGIASTEFSVMYRGMLSNIRLWELREHREKNSLHKHISSAIEALQLRKPDYLNCWSDIDSLDASSEEDRTRYITDVLPKLMGENLARFHNSGCYHKYLHDGNWTLAGEIVDLDSVTGGIIDPAEETSIDFVTRYEEFFDAYNSVVRLSSALVGITPDHINPRIDAFKKAYFAERYVHEDLSLLETVFLETHFMEPEEDARDTSPPMIISTNDLELNLAVTQLFMEFSATERTGVKADMKRIDEVLLPAVTDRVLTFLEQEGFPEGVRPTWLVVDTIARRELHKLLASLLNSSNTRTRTLATF